MVMVMSLSVLLQHSPKCYNPPTIKKKKKRIRRKMFNDVARVGITVSANTIYWPICPISENRYICIWSVRGSFRVEFFNQNRTFQPIFGRPTWSPDCLLGKFHRYSYPGCSSYIHPYIFPSGVVHNSHILKKCTQGQGSKVLTYSHH